MSKNPKITIIGSLNIDLVTTSKRFPKEGETILGDYFEKYPGGKGANQAVAAARLGASVSMIGCVGDDFHGRHIKKHLEKENINTDAIFTLGHANTGIAQISTAKEENKIIVVPGANYDFNVNMLEESKDLLKQSDIVVLQLEIPMKIIEETIKMANSYNVPVILNPAPAIDISSKILSGVSFITPNNRELSQLTNIELNTLEKYTDAFNDLHRKGVNNVIVTRGGEGVLFSERKIIKKVESEQVDVVDTTGAGDTFNGALSVALAKGNSLFEAVKYANFAAALSTTKKGAQTGMPFDSDLKNITNEQVY